MEAETKTKPETIETEFFEVRLSVTGIKKRCRNTTRHGFKMVNVTLNTKDSELAQSNMRDAAKVIINREMKSVSSVHPIVMKFTYCHTDNKSDFITSYPFDDRNFDLTIN